MADRSVKVILSANVRDFQQNIKAASTSLDELVKKHDKTGTVAQTTMGKLTQSMQLQRAEWDQAGQSMLGFGLLATGSLAGSAKAAIDWESAFAGVKKTVDSNEAGYAALNEQLREMARTLPASHAEIAGVAEAAGQLGIEKQNIADFTRTMIDLGESTNISAQEGAMAMAQFANIMGTSQTQFANLGSSIVALGNNFQTTEADILNMSMRLAGSANQIGMTEGQVFGLATALSSAGIEAEAGGTAFSRVMTEMGVAVDTGNAKLETFARVAGLSNEEFKKLFRENSGEAISKFVEGLGRMTEEGQSLQPVLEELGFTDIRLSDALKRAAGSADNFTGAMKLGNEAFVEGTALGNEAAQRYETLASKLEILKNKVVDAGISFGEVLMPGIELVVEGVGVFADALGALPGPVQAILGGMTGLAAVVGTVGGAFALMAPRVLDTFSALKSLSGVFPSLAGAIRNPIGGINRMGGALESMSTKVSGATLALGTAGLIGTMALMSDAAQKFQRDIADINQLLYELGDKGNTVVGELFQFDDLSTDGLREVISYMNEGGSAVDSFASGLNRFTSNLTSIVGWDTRSEFRKVIDSIHEVDSALSSMDISHASASFRALGEQMKLSEADMLGMINAMPAFKQSLIDTAAASGLATDDQTLLRIALGEVGPAADNAADGIEGVAEAAQSAADAFANLYDISKNYAQLNMNVDEAAINYAQTLREVSGLLETQAYQEATAIEQAEMKTLNMKNLAESGWAHVDAMKAQGDSAIVVSDRMVALSADFVDQAIHLGYTADEAVNLAQRYLDIPDNVQTKADFDNWQANNNIGSLISRIGMIPKYSSSTHTHTTEYRTVGDLANAMGRGLLGRSSSRSTVNRGGYAMGGYISGPGTGTSDSIQAWLSNGEYVIKASSVAKYGLDFLNAVNAGRFANGGLVSARSLASPVVNVAPASLAGLRMTGSLNINGALVPIIDGRIEASARKDRIVSRRPQ